MNCLNGDHTNMLKNIGKTVLSTYQWGQEWCIKV